MGAPGYRAFVSLEPTRWRWIVRIVLLAVAAAIAFSFVSSVVPPPWWVLSGLPVSPGDFVRTNAVDYPICDPWESNGAPAATLIPNPPGATSGLQISERHSPLRLIAGSEVNLGIVLPKGAEVVRLLCGSSSPPLAPSECSRQGCALPLTALVTDNLYTRGRAVVITLVTRQSVSHVSDFTGHVWIVWRPASDGERKP